MGLEDPRSGLRGELPLTPATSHHAHERSRLPFLAVSPWPRRPAAAEAPPRRHAISVDFKDADIVDIVRLFAEVGGFQVVVDPGISCKLTLKLRKSPGTTASTWP